jgi:hypothetical protein
MRDMRAGIWMKSSTAALPLASPIMFDMGGEVLPPSGCGLLTVSKLQALEHAIETGRSGAWPEAQYRKLKRDGDDRIL